MLDLERGDYSMTQISKRLVPPDDVELYLQRLRRYLAGEEVLGEGHRRHPSQLDIH